jgi:hypothetical protein
VAQPLQSSLLSWQAPPVTLSSLLNKRANCSRRCGAACAWSMSVFVASKVSIVAQWCLATIAGKFA